MLNIPGILVGIWLVFTIACFVRWVAVVEVWHPAGGTGFWNENDLSMPLTGEEDATFFEFREAVREFFNQ